MCTGPERSYFGFQIAIIDLAAAVFRHGFGGCLLPSTCAGVERYVRFAADMLNGKRGERGRSRAGGFGLSPGEEGG